MTPNLTVCYMAEQITRGRLDAVAARGWVAEEAAATRVRVSRAALVPILLGAAFIRLGERMQGTARPPRRSATQAVFLAR